MKSLKSIFSILLAFSLLASSLGITVSRHYCMGLMMHESYYTAVQSCNIDMSFDVDCEDDHTENSFGCCEYENIIIPGLVVVSSIDQEITQSDHLLVSIDLEPNTSLKLPTFHSNIRLKFHPERSNPPPLRGKDILIQHQRFLI